MSAIARKGSEAVANADVTFTVYSDSAASIIDNNATVSNKTTSASGVTAELIPGSPINRRLYVRAVSDNIASNIRSVNVTGTTVTIDGADAIASGATAEYILKIKDSANQAITTGAAVTITSSSGNTLDAGNLMTDEKGEITFTLSGDVLGKDTITASALGAIITKTINVSGDVFSLSGASTDININTDETINFIWKKDNIVQAGKQIKISSTRGTIQPSNILTTNANGQASFTISSPTAGQTTITATSGSDGLSTSFDREFIATTPAYLNTQAAPATVVPNGSSTIVARVTDSNDNPVKNKIIDFNLNDTVNGSLSASTAVTDSLGRASVSYVAGDSTSATDGVEITTFIQDHPGVSQNIVKLTVGGNALRIALGRDHLVGSTDVYYTKQVGVIVTDSAGNPVKNTHVNFTIKPTHYLKGQMYIIDTDGDGEGDEWSQGGIISDDVIQPPVVCDAEDTNGNGILEAGEDFNTNGKLEPTNDATIYATNSNITDETGALVVTVRYLKNSALWSRQTITATIGSGVGSEYSEKLSFILPILSSDVTDITSEVPNQYSPYGLAGACSDPN